MAERLRHLVGLAAGYSVADGLIRGLGFVLLPLLLAYLTPAEFGAVGALGALATLLTHLFGLGLSGSPVRFHGLLDDPNERAEFFGSALVGGSTLAAIGTGLLAIGSGPVLAWLDLAAFREAVSLTLWTAWLQVVARTIPLGILRAKDAVVPYAVVSVVAVAATLLMVFLRLAVWDEGFLGALRGTRDGAAATCIAALALVARDVRWTVQWPLLRRVLAYGLPLTPHHVAHWVLGLSDRFLVGRLLGATALGYYHFAYQFASVFQLIVSSANSALLPRFARIGIEPAAAAIRTLRRSTSAYLLTTSTLGMSIALLAPVAVARWFPAYEPSARLIPWLVLSVGFFVAYSVPMNVLTMSIGRTAGIWQITAVAGVSNVILNVLLLPRIGLPAAVAATAASYAMLFLGTRSYARRVTGLTTLLFPEGRFWRVGGIGVSAVAAIALLRDSLVPSAVLACVLVPLVVALTFLAYREELVR